MGENEIQTMSMALQPTQVKKLQEYVSKSARLMLTATFFEDAFRIVTDFSPQYKFLVYQRSIPWVIAWIILVSSVGIQLVGSCAIIGRIKTPFAVGGLIAVLLTQTIAYGYLFDFTFFVRNIAVIGGLLIILAHEKMIELKATPFSGAFNLGGSTKLTYLQLVSRCFVCILFYSLLGNHWTFWRIVGTVLVAIPVMAVVFGYRARASASLLAVFLIVANFVLNGYWSLDYRHPERDFRKYYFFQTLTVTGGLLVLAEMGPGSMSMDERDKDI